MRTRLPTPGFAAFIFAGFAATPATTSAQAFGYAFGGPVGVSNVGIRDSTTAWHVGGGGEILIRGGPLNHSYHFGGPNRATRGMRPFVTGGFSFLLDADVPMPLWNVGGGVDWWLGRHAGVRLEGRDQLWAAPALLGFRFGVVFR